MYCSQEPPLKFDIVEEKVVYEVIKNYYIEYELKIFPNWIQVGKYLIPENKFREIPDGYKSHISFVIKNF